MSGVDIRIHFGETLNDITGYSDRIGYKRICDNVINDSITKEMTVPEFEALCEKDKSYTVISPGSNGNTALHAAVIVENMGLIKHLAHINRSQGSQLKPWECIRKDAESKKSYNLFLIYNNASQTPLHLAAEHETPDAARELIRHGSPTKIIMFSNILRTPFHVAITNKNWKICGFFLRHPDLMPPKSVRDKTLEGNDLEEAKKQIMYDNEKLIKWHFGQINNDIANKILMLMVKTEFLDPKMKASLR